MGYVNTLPRKQKGRVYDPIVKKPNLPHAVRVFYHCTAQCIHKRPFKHLVEPRG